MNRCDFSSISTCLKNHISESNQMSQPDFLYELFEDFMDDPANQDFSTDNGLVCRWLTGQAKISPKISAYYSKPSNQEKLAHTIHQNLLPLMSDCNMAMQDIYTLFIQDDSISDAKKKNLIGQRVKELRTEKHMSKKALAEQLQLAGYEFSDLTVLRIEQGTRFVPDYEVVALAEFFHVSCEYLLGIKNEK